MTDHPPGAPPHTYDQTSARENFGRIRRPLTAVSACGQQQRHLVRRRRSDVRPNERTNAPSHAGSDEAQQPPAQRADPLSAFNPPIH
mmetsp:Transcript_11857/g.39052  ORF Transcript_11857/g.39052 Transcript_11857/m.39052 type:complete len:87 (-) Transcript_11857:73-333(-)